MEVVVVILVVVWGDDDAGDVFFCVPSTLCLCDKLAVCAVDGTRVEKGGDLVGSPVGGGAIDDVEFVAPFGRRRRDRDPERVCLDCIDLVRDKRPRPSSRSSKRGVPFQLVGGWREGKPIFYTLLQPNR